MEQKFHQQIAIAFVEFFVSIINNQNKSGCVAQEITEKKNCIIITATEEHVLNFPRTFIAEIFLLARQDKSTQLTRFFTSQVNR